MPAYRLLIKNLQLPESNYPFDFFLIIRQEKTGQESAAPVIYAENFECEETLPWQFTLRSIDLQIIFVELADNSKKIIKGSCKFTIKFDGKDYDAIIITNRTDKQICRIVYCAEEVQGQKTPENAGRQENSSQQQNLTKEQMYEENLISPKKKMYTQEQYQQVVKQLENMKQQYSKDLSKLNTERKFYSQYLQDSDINGQTQLAINNGETKKNEENLEQLFYNCPDTQKWYLQKYNKDKPTNILRSTWTEPEKTQKFQPSLIYSKGSSFEQTFMLTELSFKGDIQPKKIQFRQKNNNQQTVIIESPLEQAMKWETNIQLERQQSFEMIIRGQSLEKQWFSFLLTKEDKQQKVLVFDVQGQLCGKMEYRYKNVGVYEVQTTEFINMILEEDQGGNIEEDQGGNIEEGQGGNIQEEEGDHIEEEEGDDVEEMRIEKINENKFGEESVYNDSISNSQVSKPIHSQNTQNPQVYIPKQNATTQTPRIFNEQAKHHVHHEKLKKIEEQIQIEKETFQFLNDQSAVRLPGKIKSVRKQMKWKQSSDRSQGPTQKEEGSFLTETQENEQQIYKLSKPRPKRKRGKLNPGNRIQSIASSANDLQQIEQQIINKPKCEIISKSVQLSFVPQLRALSHQNIKLNKKSGLTSEISSSNSNMGLTSQAASFIIQNISVKIKKNKEDFIGKFIKLEVKQKQPYVTETISLSKSLNWKGRGYIFERVPLFTQLKISFYSDQEQPILQGQAKVCVALLSLNEPDKTIFYHDFLRGEDGQPIAEILLGYESLKKNEKSERLRNMKIRTQSDETPISNVTRVKRRSKKNKISSQKSFMVSKNKKQSKPIGFHSNEISAGVGTSSAIRSKKYTGGNVIIGRSHRFKPGNFSAIQNVPGPGNYQCPSIFKKYEK